MEKEHKRLCYIRPSWTMALLFAVCAIAFILFVRFDVQSKLAIYAYFDKPAIILSCIFSILATTSYSFYTDCLDVRILFFRVRRICWENITGAMYYKTLTSKRRSNFYNPYLIICISPCQPADPKTISFEKYDLKNARHLVRIPIAGREMEVLSLMEHLKVKVQGK